MEIDDYKQIREQLDEISLVIKQKMQEQNIKNNHKVEIKLKDFLKQIETVCEFSNEPIDKQKYEKMFCLVHSLKQGDLIKIFGDLRLEGHDFDKQPLNVYFFNKQVQTIKEQNQRVELFIALVNEMVSSIIKMFCEECSKAMSPQGSEKINLKIKETQKKISENLSNNTQKHIDSDKFLLRNKAFMDLIALNRKRVSGPEDLKKEKIIHAAPSPGQIYSR